MVRVRIAQRDEIKAAAEQVERWGYPRPLDEDDLAGLWIALEDGARCVGWYWLLWLTYEDVLLHARMDGHVVTRHVLRSLPWVGELMGARRIICERLIPGWPRREGISFLEVRHG